MTREEAIKIIRLTCPKISDSECDFETAMRFLIPELAESEDERIRKDMIEYFTEIIDNICVEEDIKHEEKVFVGRLRKWIAYLEKQKGKMTAEEFESSELFQLKLKTKYANGYQDGLAQKEQKPIQTEDEKEYVRTLKSLIADFLRGKEEIDRSYYQKIYDWLDGRHIEQKPREIEWEDIDRWLTEHYIEQKPEKYIKRNSKEWYALLSEQYNKGYWNGKALQKPEERFEEAREKYLVEWSEEDEKMRQSIIKDIEFDRNYTSATTGKVIGKYNEQIAWLKSLRPSWRPSEEQIHAIVEALKYLPNNKDEWMVLNTLVDVFKKLM